MTPVRLFFALTAALLLAGAYSARSLSLDAAATTPDAGRSVASWAWWAVAWLSLACGVSLGLMAAMRDDPADRGGDGDAND